MSASAPRHKIPHSVLVVIRTPDLQVLMMERAAWPGFWQSVTGSLERDDEPLQEAAIREVREETGLDVARYPIEDWGVENSFEIFAKHRYAPGVTHNREHVFSLELPGPLDCRMRPAASSWFREGYRTQWRNTTRPSERVLSVRA